MGNKMFAFVLFEIQSNNEGTLGSAKRKSKQQLLKDRTEHLRSLDDQFLNFANRLLNSQSLSEKAG